MKILVIKLSSLGDIIHTLPVVSGIKQKFPQVHIGWVVSRNFLPILQDNPHIDEIYVFERQKWGGGKILYQWRDFLCFIRKIRNTRYDVVLDFQGLFRSGLITLLSGAKKRIGFKNGRELSPLAYNKTVAIQTKETHAIDRYTVLAKEIATAPLNWDLPQQASTHKIIQLLNNIHKTPKPTIAFVIGTRWESKTWPVKHFATLGNLLTQKLNADIILVGTNSDIESSQKIIQDISSKNSVYNTTGQTQLNDLVAILKTVDAIVTGDSGPMHIGVVVKTPCVAVFGPTSPTKTGPYGDIHRVLQTDLPCVPCLKKQCKNSVFCLDLVTPQQVFSQLQVILSTTKKSTKTKTLE